MRLINCVQRECCKLIRGRGEECTHSLVSRESKSPLVHSGDVQETRMAVRDAKDALWSRDRGDCRAVARPRSGSERRLGYVRCGLVSVFLGFVSSSASRVGRGVGIDSLFVQRVIFSE